MLTQLIPPDQLVGRMVGQYQIVQMLGRGNANAVYVAQQPGRDHHLLLTIFLTPTTLSPEAQERFKARFMQEAASLARLRHPHIMPLYDFGEQFGYLYTITPLGNTGSVAALLKERAALTPTQTLVILKQIANALDYAHSHCVVHGSLKPLNLLINSEQQVQIVGFGLTRLLSLRDIEPSNHPFAHLLSITGAFLGTPEYTAPEVVQGAPLDARADIYALGITLFELLTGKPPFTGTDPFAVARMHVEQPLPSIQTLCPDLPAALDVVLESALVRNPAQRVASAEQLAIAFERVLHVMHASKNAPATGPHIPTDITLPPSINWFDEELSLSSGKLQAVPSSLPTTHAENTQPEQAIDPFAWWSSTLRSPLQDASTNQDMAYPVTGRFSQVAAPKSTPNKARRRMIALTATGGTIALLGIGGFGLAHLLQTKQLSQSAANQPQASSAPTTTVDNNQPTPIPTSAPPTPTTATKPTTATQPTAAPTQAPPPTPIPGHTGTVIGSTNQPVNSAITFNGGTNWLIRLANGNFVAYRNSCTHEGAQLRYDPGTQHLLCTRHNAAFNPANGATPLYGPPPSALSAVAVRVNGDGTVTV